MSEEFDALKNIRTPVSLAANVLWFITLSVEDDVDAALEIVEDDLQELDDFITERMVEIKDQLLSRGYEARLVEFP